MHITNTKSATLCALTMALFSVDAIAECNPGLNSTTPTSRFEDVGSDGASVKDTSTQLVWMRCSLGQTWNTTSANCEEDTGTPHRYTFSDALAAASSASLVDDAGWRVPNKKELASIVDYSCAEPAVNGQVFPATEAAVYWSSTPRVNTTFMAFAIDFTNGAFVDAGLSQLHAVRLVRDAL